MSKCRCDYCTSSNVRRDFRQGGEGSEQLTPHRKAGRGKKKYVRKGCPANNNEAHVYVTVSEERNSFRSTYTITRRVCCGCGKIKGQGDTAGYRPCIKSKTDEPCEFVKVVDGYRQAWNSITKERVRVERSHYECTRCQKHQYRYSNFW